MTMRRQAIQGVIWSAVQGWGTALIGMLTFLILARILDPNDFGLLALAFAYIALLEIVLRGGFGQAIIQRREVTAAHLDTAFWLNVVVGAAMAVTAVATAGTTAKAFGQPLLAGIIRWLAVTLLIGPLAATHLAILRRALDFKRLAVATLLATAAGGAVGVGEALAGRHRVHQVEGGAHVAQRRGEALRFEAVAADDARRGSDPPGEELRAPDQTAHRDRSSLEFLEQTAAHVSGRAGEENQLRLLLPGHGVPTWLPWDSRRGSSRWVGFGNKVHGSATPLQPE